MGDKARDRMKEMADIRTDFLKQQRDLQRDFSRGEISEDLLQTANGSTAGCAC
ncbi:hypothetical protein LNQ03_02850 [Klebsiella pneumoniae subsp. pneumoniae]|nr:hypothetical protein [Klebsiella pneumoniae subsp. pneumoniae]